MAEEQDSDMIMYFKTTSGDTVAAECAMEVDQDDRYAAGFQSADLDYYSNFFQITKFEFGIEVKDEDSKKAQPNGTGQAHSAHGGGRTSTYAPQSSAHGTRGAHGAPAAAAQKQKASFASWRSSKMGEKGALIYPAMPDTFSFTRLIDRASVEFFDAVCNIRSYDEAVLVKRIFRGHNSKKRGFLRIEFKKVLITNLDWDDGDMLTETCKFICQSFEIKYRPQNNDGSFGSTVPASWNYSRDAQSKDS